MVILSAASKLTNSLAIETIYNTDYCKCNALCVSLFSKL